MVVLQAMGRRVTPLAKAIASNPIYTVAMATMAMKFPPEFLQAVEEQTVMSGMGKELETAPTSGSHRETHGDPVTTVPPQPGMPDLDTTAVRIRGFLEKGARQADAARQEFEKEIHDFRAEREDLNEDMRLLHTDRVDPWSIDGMVEDSIASRLRAIHADMLGVVSMLASIRDVQQSSAACFAELNASHRMQLDKLNAAISSQHSTLVKMAESIQMRDAQLVKHSERMDRMEILFDRLDTQLPNMARCVEVCSEVGSSSTAIASNLTIIRDQTLTTAQMVTQHLDDMEETIRDTFVELKVDVLKATLTSMETTIASCFTAVDGALAKLVSPPCQAGATARPHSPAPPNLPAPPDADTERTGSDNKRAMMTLMRLPHRIVFRRLLSSTTGLCSLLVIGCRI